MFLQKADLWYTQESEIIIGKEMNHIKVGSPEHKLVMACMLIGSIISFAIMYSPQPLISLFSKEYNVSPATASFSISLTTLSLGIALLFVSMLSKAWGRKKTMCVSLITTSALAMISSLGHNFYFFLLIRFLEGISIAGFPSVAIVYLNEEFDKADVGKVVGAYVAGTAIGGFTGRVIIGALTDLFSWQIAILTLAFVSLLGSIWFWRYLPESKCPPTGTSSIKRWSFNVLGCFRDKNLVSVYSIGFLVMGVYIALLNYVGYPLTKPPYNLSQTVFGFIFVVNLTGTISAFWFGKLADKYPRANVICLATSILIIGAILTLLKPLWSIILGITMVAFGFFAAHAVACGWIGTLAPNKYKSQASAFYLLFYYLGSCLIGWFGGFFLKGIGWHGVIGYIVALASIIFAIAPRIGKIKVTESEIVKEIPDELESADEEEIELEGREISLIFD